MKTHDVLRPGHEVRRATLGGDAPVEALAELADDYLLLHAKG